MKYTRNDLAALFKQYQSKIYHLALKISRNADDAKDILQNTFLKVINNLDKFRNESSISTWIYRIAINEAYMKWRLSKRQERLANLKKESSLLSGEGFLLPDKELIKDELKQEIDSAIKSLPLKYRVAIVLRDFQDLEYEKIRRILNLSLQATKTRLHRARLMLRSKISEYNQDKLLKNNFKRPAKTSLSICNRNIKFLDSLFKDEVSRGDKKLFQKHVDGCKPCKRFIRSYKQAISLAKCLQCEDIPQELQEKINSFLNKQKS